MVVTMEQELILQAREERMKLIAKYIKNHQCVVVIKANIPGEFKNNKEAYTLLRLFEQECRNILRSVLMNSFIVPMYLMPSSHP
jgi:phosphoribosyl-dephospho-CoA transferase